MALWMGLTMPTLIMAMAAGIEVSDWAAVKVQLQRSADAAAFAGAISYGKSNDALKATTHAANVAQINGVAANQVTALIVPGVQNPARSAMKVMVARTVSLAIGKIFTTDPSVTIGASAWVELTPGVATGPPACVLALNGSSSGITTPTDITFSGSVNIDAAVCAIRSEGGISMNGSVDITTAGMYAGGAITSNGSVRINNAASPNNFGGSAHPNAGQIGDPYAGNTVLQNALSQAISASGPIKNIKGSKDVTLDPGTYTGIDATGSSDIT